MYGGRAALWGPVWEVLPFPRVCRHFTAKPRPRVGAAPVSSRALSLALPLPRWQTHSP